MSRSPNRVVQLHAGEKASVAGEADAGLGVGGGNTRVHRLERPGETLEVLGIPGRADVRVTGAERRAVECCREPADQHVTYGVRLQGAEHLLGTEARHGRSRNPPGPPRARLEIEHVEEVVEALGDLVITLASA